jgi:hypothetical protein
MKSRHRRRYWLVVTVLTMLALTLVGHVCALPHDHPVAAEDHDTGDSVHGASCEVVLSQLPATGAPILAVIAVTELVADAQIRGVATSARPRSVHAPPLFLLHASLLI